MPPNRAAILMVAMWAVVAVLAAWTAWEGWRREPFFPLNQAGVAVVDAGRAECSVKPADGPARRVSWMLASSQSAPEGMSAMCYLPSRVTDVYGCALPGPGAARPLEPLVDGDDVAAARAAAKGAFAQVGIRADVVPGVDVCAVAMSKGLDSATLSALDSLIGGDLVRVSKAYADDVALLKRESDARERELEGERQKEADRALGAERKAEACEKKLLELSVLSEPPEPPKRCTNVIRGTVMQSCESCDVKYTGGPLPCRLECQRCDDSSMAFQRRIGARPVTGDPTLSGALQFAAVEDACPILDVDYLADTSPRLQVRNSCRYNPA